VLREVRDEVASSVYSAGGDRLRRLAAATKLVPGPVAATAAQKALGPVLSARVVSHLDVRRAADLARRLPPRFLSDLCQHLDPASAGPVIAAIPATVAVSVAADLLERGDHLTVGRLVAVAPDTVVEGVLALTPDPADLLRLAYYIDDGDRLDEVVSRLSDETLLSVARIAVEDTGELWTEAIALMAWVGTEQRRRIARVVAGDRESVIAIVRAARERSLWVEILPLVAFLPSEGLAAISDVVAEVVAAGGEAVSEEAEALFQAAEETGTWPVIRDLAERAGVTHLLPEAGQPI
jgi:hypothetical protein